MSASLSITSTAEGVETEQQLTHLRREACGDVQGLLIGRPLPAEAVLPFLKGRPGELDAGDPRSVLMDPQLGSEELRWSA